MNYSARLFKEYLENIQFIQFQSFFKSIILLFQSKHKYITNSFTLISQVDYHQAISFGLFLDQCHVIVYSEHESINNHLICICFFQQLFLSILKLNFLFFSDPSISQNSHSYMLICAEYA